MSACEGKTVEKTYPYRCYSKAMDNVCVREEWRVGCEKPGVVRRFDFVNGEEDGASGRQHRCTGKTHRQFSTKE
jgi:hypothetical protein